MGEPYNRAGAGQVGSHCRAPIRRVTAPGPRRFEPRLTCCVRSCGGRFGASQAATFPGSVEPRQVLNNHARNVATCWQSAFIVGVSDSPMAHAAWPAHC